MPTLCPQKRKRFGAYFTPDQVAQSLVRWVVRSSSDRLLDPACGDGRFLRCHRGSVGIEVDPHHAVEASRWGGTVIVADFFSWAEATASRFDCIVGNPPFIRYQAFSGDTRARAQRLCGAAGLRVSGLSSSWLPFVVVSESLLVPGGRMAFVVPAEVGHSTYSSQLLSFLTSRFSDVRVIAIKDRVFPDLSQDVWLLYAAGHGSTCTGLEFVAWEEFQAQSTPPRGDWFALGELSEEWNGRLRPCILDPEQRSIYQRLRADEAVTTLGELARIGIGYVTGANAFFHLKPSEVAQWNIPAEFIIPTARNGRSLAGHRVTLETVREWIERDDECLLLHIPPNEELPLPVRRYLESNEGKQARRAFKCRTRTPWYSVPDVYRPDAFLTYMSGEAPMLVANAAGCTCTNSLLGVRFKRKGDLKRTLKWWAHPVTQLSCELEGHPLGGGLLKLEPREAARVAIPREDLSLGSSDEQKLLDAIAKMRRWRHYV